MVVVQHGEVEAKIGKMRYDYNALFIGVDLPMQNANSPRFDPVDQQQVLLLSKLPPEKRLRLMLEARQLALGLVRGRLRQQFPQLSDAQLNLKALEALGHAPRKIP
jgi:hypothetical protein